jgi:hypothetical protein
MNWKRVLYLLRVERKSGRLIRGIKATRYREHGVLAYWPYWVAIILGIIFGLLANYTVQLTYSTPQAAVALGSLSNGVLGFFVAAPTLILLFSVVLTTFQQIQISGNKATSQVMYWLPVTWQEHTLASVLSNLLGLPLAIVVGFSAGVVVFAAFNGLVVAALLTVLAMFVAAFMGSATTEIIRVLQVRFIGAVYKSSGKAAIWVRLIGTLALIAIAYTVYFYFVSGSGASSFFQGLSAVQNSFWFIPFIWLGVTLNYLFTGGYLQSTIFVIGSVLFTVTLYFFAVLLNQQFGLYEPPAIKVQTSGIYAPKTGLLGKLGFTTVEAAIIRKDVRSFTRRRELIGVFIIPIVFTIVPIFNTLNTANQGAPPELRLFFEAMMFIAPAAFMAMTIGNMLIGEEGQVVWRIYASPISPKNLVKSKYAFLVFFSIAVQIITTAIGIAFFQPSLKIAIIAILEGVFLILALGAMGLNFGFRGADFTASKRARMIRQEWSLKSLIACAFAGLAILAPLVPYVLSKVASSFLNFSISIGPVELAVSLVISGVIAAVIAMVFYRINLSSAKDLLRKAET